jgi:GNAT superfamily N-acetyltransferase
MAYNNSTTISALKENMRQSFLTLSRAPHGEIHDDPDLLSIITGIPHPIMNGIFRAQFRENQESRIDKALLPFITRKIPMMWWIGPDTEPPDLGSRLKDRGLIFEGDSPGMSMDLLPIKTSCGIPGLSMEKVVCAGLLGNFITVFAAVFQLPDIVGQAFHGIYEALGYAPGSSWRNYVASIGNRPVAIASLSLAGGVAGIWNVATLPDCRKQGIGTAITLAPLQEAFSLGYRRAVLISSSDGLGVYKKLGFSECCSFGQYIYTPPPR